MFKVNINTQDCLTSSRTGNISHMNLLKSVFVKYVESFQMKMEA